MLAHENNSYLIVSPQHLYRVVRRDGSVVHIHARSVQPVNNWLVFYQTVEFPNERNEIVKEQRPMLYLHEQDVLHVQTLHGVEGSWQHYIQDITAPSANKHSDINHTKSLQHSLDLNITLKHEYGEQKITVNHTNTLNEKQVVDITTVIPHENNSLIISDNPFVNNKQSDYSTQVNDNLLNPSDEIPTDIVTESIQDLSELLGDNDEEQDKLGDGLNLNEKDTKTLGNSDNDNINEPNEFENLDELLDDFTPSLSNSDSEYESFSTEFDDFPDELLDLETLEVEESNSESDSNVDDEDNMDLGMDDDAAWLAAAAMVETDSDIDLDMSVDDDMESKSNKMSMTVSDNELKELPIEKNKELESLEALLDDGLEELNLGNKSNTQDKQSKSVNELLSEVTDELVSQINGQIKPNQASIDAELQKLRDIANRDVEAGTYSSVYENELEEYEFKVTRQRLEEYLTSINRVNKTKFSLDGFTQYLKTSEHMEDITSDKIASIISSLIWRGKINYQAFFDPEIQSALDHRKADVESQWLYENNMVKLLNNVRLNFHTLRKANVSLIDIVVWLLKHGYITIERH